MADKEGSGFTEAHLAGVKAMGWRAASSIPVIIERALAAGERFVDVTPLSPAATAERIRADGIARVVEISAPPEVRRYVVQKGSIAVDGVSLTVAAETERGFEIWLIPHTCEVTTLGRVDVGDRVNLEADIYAKYVERFAAER